MVHYYIFKYHKNHVFCLLKIRSKTKKIKKFGFGNSVAELRCLYLVMDHYKVDATMLNQGVTSRDPEPLNLYSLLFGISALYLIVHNSGYRPPIGVILFALETLECRLSSLNI